MDKVRCSTKKYVLGVPVSIINPMVCPDVLFPRSVAVRLYLPSPAPATPRDQ